MYFTIGPILSDQLLFEAPFPWQQRLHVALGQNASCKGWSLEEVTYSDSLPGAAKGLAHMVGSTPKTFHRDIKWDAQIGARCCPLLLDLLKGFSYIITPDTYMKLHEYVWKTYQTY